jgi:hypothetical protein
MLDALEAVAGTPVRRLVRHAPDARIAAIVANWPRGASAARAARLGLTAPSDFESVIREYIADREADHTAAAALKGLVA